MGTVKTISKSEQVFMEFAERIELEKFRFEKEVEELLDLFPHRHFAAHVLWINNNRAEIVDTFVGKHCSDGFVSLLNRLNRLREDCKIKSYTFCKEPEPGCNHSIYTVGFLDRDWIGCRYQLNIVGVYPIEEQ
jgi:hypothetical protein